MQNYTEDEYLLLSGIQHYAFCPRQWALIHIENLWQENYFTAAGRVFHNKTHDGDTIEKRGDVIIFRSLKVSSSRLGISGVCDVVEFHKSKNGIPLKNYEDLWSPYPVEYKRGKSKVDDCDRLQLCAQAACLEEMLCCEIKKGALFYGEPRRREIVEFSAELRRKLEVVVKSMHELFSKKHTPKSKTGKFCSSCSLKNLCLPKLCEKSESSVRKYLEDNIK
ncbi:MAG: CRISPR-associated protein Cas4 [Oscillospiraceae bacterium]|nr:CRISPR-associated protein Cas4 [Oscillospiraceae bacterium]